MKKKKLKSKKNAQKEIMPDLPQNIMPVGERVFEDKNIYIHQKVYSQIHKFSANKTENEHGGILVGRVVNEMGKENTIIEGFIEAKHNVATSNTLTFTHKTWEYFHAEIARKHKDKKIVGWIHTHPNFGIFLSENDRFIQKNFFADTNQIAYVVDPIQKEEGFFFWIKDTLERCPGFYLFDKNGVKIKQKPWEAGEENLEDKVISKSRVTPIIMTVLFILVIMMFIITITQTERIQKLEKKVADQEIVLQYGIFGMQGAPEVSNIADSIRQQLEKQEKAKRAAMEEVVKQQESGQSENRDVSESSENKGIEKNNKEGQ